MRKFTHKEIGGITMPQPFGQNYYNPYMPQVQPPMDRLAQLQAQQLQAQQYQMPQNMQTQQPNQSMIYVQGESAAKSWMVGAGQSVLLMDSEAPVFYIKSTDNSGIPLPLRVFDYQERTQTIPQNAPQAQQSEQIDLDSKYVTRGEYDALQGKYMEILDRLNNFPANIPNVDDSKRSTTGAGKARNKGGNANEQSSI